MADNDWISILERQPQRGQRVLVKLLGGQVRMTNYDQYSWEQWCIREWKRLPDTEKHRNDT